jgi:hypothetical protein
MPADGSSWSSGTRMVSASAVGRSEGDDRQLAHESAPRGRATVVPPPCEPAQNCADQRREPPVAALVAGEHHLGLVLPELAMGRSEPPPPDGDVQCG